MARKKSGKAEGLADLETLLEQAEGKGSDAGNDGGRQAESDAAGDAAVAALDREETAIRLKACATRLLIRHAFRTGQLVQWKRGLKNRRTPAYGEPVVVVESLARPVYDEEIKSGGNPYFREPLTLIAGELDKDGDFICFHYDGRRFEPYLK